MAALLLKKNDNDVYYLEVEFLYFLDLLKGFSDNETIRVYELLFEKGAGQTYDFLDLEKSSPIHTIGELKKEYLKFGAGSSIYVLDIDLQVSELAIKINENRIDIVFEYKSIDRIQEFLTNFVKTIDPASPIEGKEIFNKLDQKVYINV